MRIVNGQKLVNSRPLLAGGDAEWADAYLECIKRLPADRRLEELRKFIRLAYALTETRANGSDRFYNSRVAAYAKHMGDKERSSAECARVWGDMRGLYADGCPMIAAARFVDASLMTSNRCEWALRSGNMVLMWLILVTDVMLGFNYYNSSFDAAQNGLGPTIIVRDGGGSFRRLVREFGVWKIMHVFGKVNGCGADYAMSTVQKASALKEYIELANAGQEPWMIVASTSEQGLLRMFCKISEEEAGKDRVVTHDIGECGSRFATAIPKATPHSHTTAHPLVPPLQLLGAPRLGFAQ